MLKSVSLNYNIPCTEYLAYIRHMGKAILLDSGFPKCTKGRYDIIAADPISELIYQDGSLSGKRLPFSLQAISDPFQAVSMLQEDAKSKCKDDLLLNDSKSPFCGGLIGYFGYDLGRCIEKMPNISCNDTKLPDMHLGLYGWAIIIDHQQKESFVIANSLIKNDDFDQLVIFLSNIKSHSTRTNTKDFKLTSSFNSNLNKTNYTAALEKINDYILSGDCYQVNFAQRFSANYVGDPLVAYLTLREAAPTHFSAFIDTDQGAVLSLSPERFLSVDSTGKVITQPIKGTQPRDNDSTKDQQNKEYLKNSEKDRSENLMIVDLMRNDISKSCEPHSVEVPALFSIESYRNVHHLVSTITGQLTAESSPIHLLRNCFPGGSITGTPKIRAMEIIDELEPHRRSIYCGSIGYISLCGQMDTSITIRTLLAENNTIHCWAGGGIVADSEINDEYQETFDKVNNLLNALKH